MTKSKGLYKELMIAKKVLTNKEYISFRNAMFPNDGRINYTSHEIINKVAFHLTMCKCFLTSRVRYNKTSLLSDDFEGQFNVAMLAKAGGIYSKKMSDVILAQKTASFSSKRVMDVVQSDYWKTLMKITQLPIK